MSDLNHGAVRALRPGLVPHQLTHEPPQVAQHPVPQYPAGQGAPSQAPGHVAVASDIRRRVSDDEVKLLALLADGLPVEAIARRLALSDRTVRRRSRALCDRLGARAPIQVVAWAARHGLI